MDSPLDNNNQNDIFSRNSYLNDVKEDLLGGVLLDYIRSELGEVEGEPVTGNMIRFDRVLTKDSLDGKSAEEIKDIRAPLVMEGNNARGLAVEVDMKKCDQSYLAFNAMISAELKRVAKNVAEKCRASGTSKYGVRCTVLFGKDLLEEKFIANLLVRY